MSELTEWIVPRIAALLIAVQVLSFYFVWVVMTEWGTRSAQAFALYLGVDLVSFAMISYMYRKSGWKGGINRAALISGCVMVLLLLFASLLISFV